MDHHMNHSDHSGHSDHSDHMHHMDHMDHMDMDMNDTNVHDHSMHMMMKMYFHTDLGDTLLIKDWTLSTTSQTVIACLVFFILAILYEGLKSYREFLFKRYAAKQSYTISVINTKGPSTANEPSGCPETCVGSGDGKPPLHEAVVTCKRISSAHIYQSLLHILQVVTSYTLMLGFMTFNVWICLSIALGAGYGYFFFCWKRLTVVDITEHCN